MYIINNIKLLKNMEDIEDIEDMEDIEYIGVHINKQKTLLNTMEFITYNNGNSLQFFASNPRSIQLANIEKYRFRAIIQFIANDLVIYYTFRFKTLNFILYFQHFF